MDKSYGGDMIMANRSIEQIKKSDEKINVYLEMDSINHDLLEYFIAKHEIQKERLVIHNRVQDEIKLMKNSPKTPPTIIVTYNPYDIQLGENGFEEIASTRNSQDLFVVDAIYTSSKFYNEHPQEFKKLDKIIARSLEVLRKNPKEYYEKVKLYLDNPSYDEFLEMNKNIVWIHMKMSDEDKNNLSKIQFPIKDIMR